MIGIILISLPLALIDAYLASFAHQSGIPEFTRHGNPYAFHGWDGFVVAVAATSVMPALCEEYLFRGALQPALIARFGSLRGILTSAVLFAAFHLNPVMVVAVLPVGVLLGYLYHRFKTLGPCMLLHGLNNIWVVVFTNFEVPPAERIGIYVLCILSLVIGIVYVVRSIDTLPVTSEIAAAA
jgi:membrane protease YdiL (CAAX protease family)